MKRLSIVLTIVAVILPSEAWAQQQPPQKQIGQDVRQKCREEVRKLCTFLIPSQAAIQSCVAENKDKFSEQCRTVLLTAPK